MPLRKEEPLERLRRLEKEASVVQYQERKDKADREHEERMKDISRKIAEIKTNGEIKKVALTHRWELGSQVLKKLVMLPVIILLLPFIGYLLIRNRDIPKWIKTIFE